MAVEIFLNRLFPFLEVAWGEPLGADGSGDYLGRYSDTDGEGYAEFQLPDRQYKFRVDFEGTQYWNDVIDIIPHEVNEIDMDLDLLGFDLTGSRLYAHNKPKSVLLALVGFPYSFFVSSVIAAPEVSETIYYYQNDHLGTPQVLTDDNGQVVWKADYKPFGEVDILTEEVRNNFRFPGQYYDQETGLHYNYFRDYHPEIGRYVEPDPSLTISGDANIPFLLHLQLQSPQELNPYVYVGNNPMNFTDPLGLGHPTVCGNLRITCLDECAAKCDIASDEGQMCMEWCNTTGLRSCIESKGPGKYPKNPFCKEKDECQ